MEWLLVQEEKYKFQLDCVTNFGPQRDQQQYLLALQLKREREVKDCVNYSLLCPCRSFKVWSLSTCMCIWIMMMVELVDRDLPDQVQEWEVESLVLPSQVRHLSTCTHNSPPSPSLLQNYLVLLVWIILQLTGLSLKLLDIIK